MSPVVEPPLDLVPVDTRRVRVLGVFYGGGWSRRDVNPSCDFRIVAGPGAGR